jgi:homoserine kinase
MDPVRTAQVAAAAVAAVMMAMTMDKSPNKKKIRRRWMLRIERHV